MEGEKKRGGSGWWAIGGMVAAMLILYVGCYYAMVRIIVPTPEQRRQYLRTSNPPTVEREMVFRSEAIADYPDFPVFQVRLWLHWLFWPIHLIDRHLRPRAWHTNPRAPPES